MSENKPQHPVIQIPNIKLENFEKLVYTRQYEEAGQMLLDMIRKLRIGAVYIGYPTDEAILSKLHTRFAAAVFTLFADPGFEVSPEGFSQMCAEHSTVDMLFRASAFDTSDHMLPQIADILDPAHPSQISFNDPIKLLKFLLTYSMRSGFELRFRETFAKSPQILLALYIGMLSHLMTVAVKAQERRELLLTMSDVFEEVNLTDYMLPLLADAYMYTSYGLGEQRHAFKGLVHRLCAKMIAQHSTPLPSKDVLLNRRLLAKSTHRKPVMIIPLDWFTSLHAMYRCWAPAIRQLRAHFKLIAFSQASAIDEEAKKEFDEWYEVKAENIVLAEVIAQIIALKPDVIYYPSVGMTLWWITTASLRLAPVQVMTLGHPASSFSPHMDYVIADEGTFADAALFSERMVELPERSLFHFDMRPDAEFPEVVDRSRNDIPDVVRVAVPAMVCKLNATQMSVLREIKSRSKTPIEFHFFPNMIGLLMHQTAREIRDWLPGALIYERMAYNQYLIFLNQCDVHLGTFPFGGTNSNIDSMKLGIPLVVMEGKEPFERMDAIMLRKVGMPEWCIATTREEYIEAALRMINEHSTRLALRKQLLASPLEEIFFTPCDNQHFGNAMLHLYKNHEAIQAGEERWVKL